MARVLIAFGIVFLLSLILPWVVVKVTERWEQSMELIDRNELKDRLKWGWMNDKFVLRTIDEMPVADPLQHGHWIVNDEAHPAYWLCSVCRERCSHFTYDFCPWCGAKMNGGDNEN